MRFIGTAPVPGRESSFGSRLLVERKRDTVLYEGGARQRDAISIELVFRGILAKAVVPVDLLLSLVIGTIPYAPRPGVCFSDPLPEERLFIAECIFPVRKRPAIRKALESRAFRWSQPPDDVSFPGLFRDKLTLRTTSLSRPFVVGRVQRARPVPAIGNYAAVVRYTALMVACNRWGHISATKAARVGAQWRRDKLVRGDVLPV